MYDALVIGGGPAGLQAALTLGRMHRPTLLLDSGSYRNDPVEAMHNVLTNDGRHPADFRAAVRSELATYDDVEVRDGSAATVERLDDGTFQITLENGSTVESRTLVLATGLRDVIPPVPGLAEQWGRTVHMCPFCDGHELTGRRVAVEEDEGAPDVVAMLAPIAETVQIVPPVTGVEMTSEGLHVSSDSGKVVVDALFTHPEFEQSAPFASQLGLEMRDSGCIAIDVFGHTSVQGVLAAGDLAHIEELPQPVMSVLAAASAGEAAGAAALSYLIVPEAESA